MSQLSQKIKKYNRLLVYSVLAGAGALLTGLFNTNNHLTSIKMSIEQAHADEVSIISTDEGDCG